MISNDGIELALSSEGSGPDLLFVHGLGSARVFWFPFIAQLSDRYRCWNLDLRGHGASGRAPGAYRLGDYTSDVRAALDHIGGPTIGIGHSLGGLGLCGVAAAGHEALVGLYVLDSPLLRTAGEGSSVQGPFERQLAMIKRFQPEGRPVGDYEAVLADAPNPVGGTNRETMLASQLRGRAESLSQLDPECMEVVLRGEILEQAMNPVVTVPIRVIAADPDRGAAFRPEHADMLRDLSPQAEVETILGVGHQLIMMKGFDEQIRLDLEWWLETVAT